MFGNGVRNLMYYSTFCVICWKLAANHLQIMLNEFKISDSLSNLCQALNSRCLYSGCTGHVICGRPALHCQLPAAGSRLTESNYLGTMLSLMIMNHSSSKFSFVVH